MNQRSLPPISAGLAVLLVLSLLLLGLFTTPTVLAPQEGPKYAGASGTGDWNNPDRAVGSEESLCSRSGYGMALRSQFWNTFGFGIPSGDVIDGILVEVKWSWDNDPPNAGDTGITLGKDESTLSVEKTWGTQQPNSERACNSGQEIDSQGGSTDLWGLAWTPGEINSDSFTVRVRKSLNGQETDIWVNWIRVTVYHHDPGCEVLTVTTSDPAGQLWFNETVEPDGVPFTTQVNVSASFQTGATPALSVTNDGTGTCDVAIRLLTDPGTGRSLKFNTTNSAPWPADPSKEVPLDPSSVTACSAVASGGTCNIWLWADYESALAGQTLADVRVETI